MQLIVGVAAGPAFDLNLGWPILDDFQGWGFRLVFNCSGFSKSVALDI
jgi:hypothetical protein